MLRGAGRVHRQHIKQAVLSVGKLYEPISKIFSPCSCIHSSCFSHAAHPHALAVNNYYSQHVAGGGHSAHVNKGPSNVHLSVATLPSSVRGVDNSVRAKADCGPFPSRVIDVVDAFACGSSKQRKRVLKNIASCPVTLGYFVHRESARRLAQALASSTQPGRSQAVMLIAHKLGCCFKPNHFESVVYVLSLQDHWSFVAPLVAVARNQCGRLTVRLLNWKMRALIECQRFDRLSRVMSEFSRDGVQPVRRTFHLLVSGHLRNRDLNSAIEGIQMMESAGFPVDASTHALIATAYRSLGSDPQVHSRAIDSLRNVDRRTATHVLNSIMQQSLDVGDESVAHRYIKLFGITDAASKIFATPGNGITEAVGGFPATAYHSIDPIHLLRVDPDTATFTILINYLAKRHRLCEVHELLDRMVDVGVKPDSGIIAALIRAYCLNHRDDLAMGLLAAMLYPDDAARMLHHLIGVKFVPEQTIDVKGIQLTVHVFNAILGRAVELRGLSGARFIFRTMHTRGIKPNAATVEIFLDYLDRTESVNPLQLIRILRSMSTATHGPTLRHLHVILRNILRQGKYLVHRSGWDAIASKFSPTRESIPDLTPDFIMVGSNNFEPGNGLTSSWRSRYDSWLRPIVLSLSRRAINSDRATIAMQLRHASMLDPSLDTARDVFRHMIDQGIHPNRYHYTALMDGYAKGGNMVGAERTMRAAREAGFGPEVVMYTVLIDGYGRQGKPELAMQAFCRMVSAGIAPDVAAIDALARAYFIVGGYNVARRVLLQLWSQVKPFPPELQGATLKHLAASFRSHSADGMSRKQFLTRCQQKLLGRKVRCFQQEWRQLELLQGIHSGRLNRCRAWLLKYSQDSAVDHHT